MPWGVARFAAHFMNLNHGIYDLVEVGSETTKACSRQVLAPVVLLKTRRNGLENCRLRHRCHVARLRRKAGDPWMSLQELVV